VVLLSLIMETVLQKKTQLTGLFSLIFFPVLKQNTCSYQTVLLRKHLKSLGRNRKSYLQLHTKRYTYCSFLIMLHLQYKCKIRQSLNNYCLISRFSCSFCFFFCMYSARMLWKKDFTKSFKPSGFCTFTIAYAIAGVSTGVSYT